jgi:protein-S-isoprenylcysteine O-methyltransferase Ste14
MSNNSAVARLSRWFLVNLLVAAVVFGLSGRYEDPWLWGLLAALAILGLYPALLLDQDLARERFHPPEAGADRLFLRATRLLAIALIVVSCLDLRWRITPVADSLRLLGIAGVAASFALFFRAMMANRFFSAVIRIQRDRGHHVIDQGPYAIVRHPGYAGMLPSMAFAGLALGSWMGFAIGVGCTLLGLRRVFFEDAFLKEHLMGYREYATRVRYRLIPGVW